MAFTALEYMWAQIIRESSKCPAQLTSSQPTELSYSVIKFSLTQPPAVINSLCAKQQPGVKEIMCKKV